MVRRTMSNIMKKLVGMFHYGYEVINVVCKANPLDIVFNPDNPKPRMKSQKAEKGSFKNLKDSIFEYGVLEPIHVHRNADGVLVVDDGNRRLIIAIQLELEFIPIIINEESDIRFRESNVNSKGFTGRDYLSMWLDGNAQHLPMRHLTELDRLNFFIGKARIRKILTETKGGYYCFFRVFTQLNLDLGKIEIAFTKKRAGKIFDWMLKYYQPSEMYRDVRRGLIKASTILDCAEKGNPPIIDAEVQIDLSGKAQRRK